MDEYVKEISQLPLLSDEETNKLIDAMQHGDTEAREKLIKHNLRMVLKIAYQYRSRINLPMEDLISIGSFGLINAIDKFDINRGVKLSTIAYPCIKNQFNKYIYLSKMQKRDNSKDVSLQSQVYKNKDGDGITWEESIVDYDGAVEDTIIQKIQNERLREILKHLTREEREILYLRYGIIDGIAHTLEEISQEKEVTKECIRQRELKALKKLKHPRITRQIKDFFEE